MNITWKTETEVFEYPSFESSKGDEDTTEHVSSRTSSSGGGVGKGPAKSLKTNTSVGSSNKGEILTTHVGPSR